MNHSKFLGYCTGRRFELYLEGDVLGKFVIKVGGREGILLCFGFLGRCRFGDHCS